MKRQRSTNTMVDLDALGSSPSELFTQLIANAIEEKPAMFLSERGTVAFVVEGDRDFSVRYGNLKEPLAWGADQDADLRMTTDRAGLGRIIDGTIDAEQDISSGALRLEGNLEMLPLLFRLMERAQSMVELRASL